MPAPPGKLTCRIWPPSSRCVCVRLGFSAYNINTAVTDIEFQYCTNTLLRKPCPHMTGAEIISVLARLSAHLKRGEWKKRRAFQLPEKEVQDDWVKYDISINYRMPVLTVIGVEDFNIIIRDFAELPWHHANRNKTRNKQITRSWRVLCKTLPVVFDELI